MMSNCLNHASACAAVMLLAFTRLATASGEPTACGPACVSRVCELCGHPTRGDVLVEVFDGRLEGSHSLRDLERAAESLGLSTRLVKEAPGNPALLRPAPMIVALSRPRGSSENHFVVLYGRNRSVVQVLDPPQAPQMWSIDELARRWDGSRLYVAATEETLAAVRSDVRVDAVTVLVFSLGVLVVGVAALRRGKRRGDISQSTMEVPRQSSARNALTVLLLASVVWSAGCTDESNTMRGLRVEQLLPVLTGSPPVLADRHEEVDFVYVLTNTSAETLSGLRLDMRCACGIVEHVPEQLGPGESARVHLRLRAPIGGSTLERIAIRSGQEQAPLAWLEPALRVRNKPPEFFPPPGDFAFRVVVGGEAVVPCRFSTLEERGDANWITGARIEMDGRTVEGTVIANVVSEFLEEVCPRQYVAAMNFSEWEVGEYNGQLTFVSGTQEMLIRPCRLCVVPPVSVIPASLTFPRDRLDAGIGPRRVVIVDRTGIEQLEVESIDEGLLQISPVFDNDRLVALDVLPGPRLHEIQEAVVTLRDSSRSYELTVSVEPSDED